MMLAFQNTPLDSAMFYDAQLGISIYGSLFNPLTKEPFPAYNAFRAYNELYKLGEQVEAVIDAEGLYVLAAKSDKKGCVVIANPTENEVKFNLNAGGKVTGCLLTADGKNEEETELSDVISGNSILVIFIDI